MSYVDALSRISDIQSQIAALDSSFSGGATTTSDTDGSSGTGSSFATQLAQAQDASPTSTGSLSDTVPIAADPDTATAADPVTAAAALGATGGIGAAAQTGAATPAASSLLSSAQQQFAARLSADTGLDSGVVDSWLLAEESGSAATSRQSADNNDWLNIGYTDSATYGSSDSVWSDPVSAADATAGWLAGKDTIPGYGTASSGVQSILQTVGQGASAQIAAIQGSGWASSGYPDLPTLYQQVTG